MVDLITGIIILVVGIILFAISRAITDSTISKVCYYLGLALIIIGAVVVVIAVVYIAMLVAAAAPLLLPPTSSPLT